MLQFPVKNGDEDYCREVVNANLQYDELLKEHDWVLKDWVGEFDGKLVLGVILLIVSVIVHFVSKAMGGDNSLDGIMFALVIFLIVFCALYGRYLHNKVRRMMEDTRTAILTLDDHEISFNKADSQTIRISWPNVAIVRIFHDIMVFVAADQKNVMITVGREHEKEILAWIRENQADIKIVGLSAKMMF